MSYRYLKNCLSSLSERVLATFQEAHFDAPAHELAKLGESLEDEHHELSLARTFAAMGLWAVIDSLKKLDAAVERDRTALGSDERLSRNYTRVVDFAEQVVTKEISTFQAAQKAYLDAIDH